MIDVARVEVLCGPQGTLFGSGALGGAVRVMLTAPNLTDFEGKAVAEYSNMSRRGGHNYSVQDVVNVPVIEDKLAIRFVGYHFMDDGFVDNVSDSRPLPSTIPARAFGVVTRDRENIGGQKTTAARGTLLWRPLDGLSVTLMHLYQRIEQDGFSDVDLGVSSADYLTVASAHGPEQQFGRKAPTVTSTSPTRSLNMTGGLGQHSQLDRLDRFPGQEPDRAAVLRSA